MLSTLGRFQRYAECSRYLYEYLGRPSPTDGPNTSSGSSSTGTSSKDSAAAAVLSERELDVLVWIGLLSQIDWDEPLGAQRIHALDKVARGTHLQISTIY